MSELAGVYSPATAPTRERWSAAEGFGLLLTAAAASAFTDDWTGACAVGVLWFVWKYMRDDEGLPVLAMALTFQWLQVTAGVWYFAATGRQIDAIKYSDYRPMVLVGLGCVLSIAIGLHWGLKLVRRWDSKPRGDGIELGVRWTSLIGVYGLSLAAQGFLLDFAFDHPDFTQPILAVKFIHLAVLFVILRRLTRPVVRWWWIAGVVGLEIVIGLTGYFAGFRDPIVMTTIVMFEVFNPRKLQHWLIVSVLAIAMFIISTMWMNVRTQYRAMLDAEVFEQTDQSKFSTMADLANNWLRSDAGTMADHIDALVNRVWAIYYPALAMARVPSILPHTDGSILFGAVAHVISPRVFFPSKAGLQSDSEMVRKYAGVYAAGSEKNTSIAFGYAAEMYLDFGLPEMFIPLLAFGFLMGAAYEELRVRIRHDDLRRGLLAVIFWLSLYLFERSLVKMMGTAGTLMVYLGGPALLLDYYLSRADLRDHSDDESTDADRLTA
jgi:hypothetical protein